MRACRLRPELVLFAALALAGCGKGDPAMAPSALASAEAGAVVGLYTSLPIAWNESADIQGMLADDGPAHWALSALRERGRVVALDTLAGDGAGKLGLPSDAVLVLAQPRALTPQENVALDAWVQDGGRVLLLVDPMLTAHSLFAPGDPRRPQDIAMLSPILARWGLQLEFDDAQAPGRRVVSLPEGVLPVDMAGTFRILGKTGDEAPSSPAPVARCRLEAAGLMADCRAGKGRIVALADAALLANPEETGEVPKLRAVLGRLLDRLSPQPGAGA